MKTEVRTFKKIVKRNGTNAAFDSQKITNAIAKAGRATSEFEDDVARRLTIRVLAVAHDLSLQRPACEDQGHRITSQRLSRRAVSEESRLEGEGKQQHELLSVGIEQLHLLGDQHHLLAQ